MNKTFILLFFICIILSAAFFLPEANYESSNILAHNVIIRRVEEKPDAMAFACNVDWGSEWIPEMIRIFEEEDIRITFFPTGNWAKKNPKLLRQIYIYNHEIGNHGYSHKLAKQLSKEAERKEILDTEKVILDLVNIKTSLYGPPSGEYDEDTLSLCKELNYDLILWSIDTIDWKEGSTADIITQRVLDKPLEGSIVLMHPKEETVKALPGIIQEIKEKDIKIVSIGELIS
ncbi:MAG: polysaccharide deacetylase family protein [Peptostreptococcales bacterium]